MNLLALLPLAQAEGALNVLVWGRRDRPHHRRGVRAAAEAVSVTDKQATLEWLNERLEEWGWPTMEAMPKGLRRSSLRCPIACALPGASVGAADIRLPGGETVPFPPPVKRFVAKLDAGAYPELQLRVRDTQPSRVAVPA